MRLKTICILLVVSLSYGCSCDEQTIADLELRPASEQLLRASMALRGVRPSLDEFQQVENNPDALGGIIDTWLSGEAFGQTIRDMHAEQLKFRSDLFDDLPPPIGALNYSNQYDVIEAVYEGPLVLVEDIVRSGQPYTEIVTSRTLRTNSVGADLWGAAFDTNGAKWQSYTPTDGRPAWGILSDNAMWLRHVSNGGNYQRARANSVAEALLCESFLTRDIPLGDDIDLSDDNAVSEALYNQPECIACHQSLDPLGGFLSGFLSRAPAGDLALLNSTNCTPIADMDLGNINSPREIIDGAFCYPLEMWLGSLELPDEFQDLNPLNQWEQVGLRAPGYYGMGTDQSKLGSYIAEDPRFLACTVKRFYSYLTQTNMETMPLQTQGELLKVFKESGLDARELAKAVVLSDPFRAKALEDGRDIVSLQSIRPEQYARFIEDLTGFRWIVDVDGATGTGNCQTAACTGEADMAQSDIFGFRLMAGGMDGVKSLAPTHTVIPTKVLVMARYAAEAAGYVVDENFSSLLTQVTAETTDETAIRNQLQELHQRILGESVLADSESVSETYELFESSLSNNGNAERAWKVVLNAMFQDPSVMFY